MKNQIISFTVLLAAGTTSFCQPVVMKHIPIEDVAVASVTLEGYPDWIGIDRSSVWVSNGGLLQRLHPETQDIVAEVAINHPCAAFAIGFGSVWVASCGDKAIVRISLDNNQVTASIPLAVADEEGSIVAAENSVWVLSDSKGILTRIDPATNKVVASIIVKPNSFAVMSGFGAIWITNTGDKNNSAVNGSVQRIDPRTNKITATIPVGKQPRFLAVGEGGVWAFNQGDGTVSRIDPQSNKVATTIDCGLQGTGGDIATGEGYVWVRGKKELVVVIDPSTNKVIEALGPPAGSGAVRVGNGYVWISAHDINKVWKVSPDFLLKKTK